MSSSQLNDPKVKAYLINAILNGIKTEIIEDQEREDFCSELVNFLNNHPLEINAVGDIDGILIETFNSSEPIGLILVRKGLIEFRIFSEVDNLDGEEKLVFSRAILTTIGFVSLWHGGDEFSIKPASGLVHGGGESGITWDDDGFGIT
ncbi:MAG: hypothetical protein CBC29_06835 [Methylococcaceae bacterium TMED69]|nr:MAG: hypothetical protein CBC29_06835 [Methylococcaceae bacterium TMED69]|tara:strand:+ start:1581 stop:2024 length:444 start_codon:yes stop_codon:yes gene_type:complete